MKSLLLAAILFVTVLDQVEARCKKAPVSSAVIKKKLEAFTQMKKNDKGKWVPVAESPCWYDLTKNNCGTCKKGGKQCGYPMSKYCQSPKSKTGCPGIPDFKYTLSTEGGPCYWDTNNLKCSICTKKSVKQCANSKNEMEEEKCYSTCGSAKNKKCDGNYASCLTIPRCGPGASCHKKTGRCKCGDGLTGNGQQCFQGNCATGNCTLVTDEADSVDIEIDTKSQFFVFTQNTEL